MKPGSRARKSPSGFVLDSRPAKVWNTKTLDSERQIMASVFKTGINRLQSFDREAHTEYGDKDREMRLTCDITEHRERRPMSKSTTLTINILIKRVSYLLGHIFLFFYMIGHIPLEAHFPLKERIFVDIFALQKLNHVLRFARQLSTTENWFMGK
ncbi:hypothetical protein YC2023_011449 [Brassica napus]